MKAVNFLPGIFLLLTTPVPQARMQSDFCHIKNTTTQDGEEIRYTVFYSAAGLFVHAGSASFINKLEKLNGKAVYHMIGEGRSNSRYDWIYKVRDRYESYIDTATMQPLQFFRDVQDGKTKKKERVVFNRKNNTATSDSNTIKVPVCVQDVMSTIYYARNIDFSSYKKNDRIPFNMFLENEVHELYIRYMGKEEIKTTYGKFRTIKFKAMLVEGTLFSGGENMTVWVSDDANRLPVRIQSPILIGNIKVDMSGYNNLRHPLTALEKKKVK